MEKGRDGGCNQGTSRRELSGSLFLSPVPLSQPREPCRDPGALARVLELGHLCLSCDPCSWLCELELHGNSLSLSFNICEMGSRLTGRGCLEDPDSAPENTEGVCGPH